MSAADDSDDTDDGLFEEWLSYYLEGKDCRITWKVRISQGYTLDDLKAAYYAGADEADGMGFDRD